MEYRHGPISVAGPGTVVWSLDALPPRLGDEIRATGAALIEAARATRWSNSWARNSSPWRWPNPAAWILTTRAT